MLRRLIDATKTSVQRFTARTILAGTGVLAATGGGLWGWQHVKSTPPGPTKQITTGVNQPAAAKNPLRPALASLSDEQLPTSPTGGNIQQLQFAQPAESSSRRTPTTGNSYLPTANDPAGGSAANSASPYGGSSPYGSSASQYGSSDAQYTTATSPSGQSAGAPPATMPLDPTSAPPATSPDPAPANPYRADSSPQPPTSYPPLSQSPYATSASPSPGGYGSPASEQSPASAPVTFPSTTAPVTVPDVSIPPNPLPATTPSNLNPYANSLSPSNRLPASLSTNPTPQPPSPSPQSPTPTAALGNFSRTTASLTSLALPTPGERQFEGPQQPSVALEKVSPSEIQVGKPATFALYVRNMGQVAAQNVVITDHVPAGTQLIEARPQPQPSSDGSLVWNLGTLQPGEETQLTVQVMPQTEGEIGSTAHISFSAAATSRSISTRPQLAIEHTAPAKVLIGESLAVGITVSNPGTGPATGVIIEEDVPPGLSHVAGSQLEYDVGVLRPGESKHMELSLRADRAGIIQNRIQVRGDAGLAGQHVVQIEVVAPQLQVTIEGPKRRFLERPATYTLQIANPGTATGRDVDLIAHLPRGMRFVSTDSQGQYDPSRHAVLWSLAELQPSQAGVVKLTAMPIEPGEQKIQVEGRAALNLSATADQLVLVEQSAELVHTVKDLDEVIEVGSDTTYEIRVKNQGTKAATNVRIAAIMPAGLAGTSGDGPTRATGDATQIAFAPLERLNPQEEVIYKVQAQGRAAGDQIVRVQLSADDLPTVTREESTRVYQDR